MESWNRALQGGWHSVRYHPGSPILRQVGGLQTPTQVPQPSPRILSQVVSASPCHVFYCLHCLSPLYDPEGSQACHYWLEIFSWHWDVAKSGFPRKAVTYAHARTHTQCLFLGYPAEDSSSQIPWCFVYRGHCLLPWLFFCGSVCSLIPWVTRF